MNINDPKTRKRILSGAYGPYLKVPCLYCDREIKVPPFLGLSPLCPACQAKDDLITEVMGAEGEIRRKLDRGEPVDLPIFEFPKELL